MVKVMDFGLAKLLDKGSQAKINGSVVTGAEFAVGTPGYMCPEQARGEDMDHRGDLYSVGVILYELLTGCLPFAGRCTMDVLLAHATEEPPTFTDIGFKGNSLPNVELVIRSCLAKDPADRPATARELSERYELAIARDQVGLFESESGDSESSQLLERTPGGRFLAPRTFRPDPAAAPRGPAVSAPEPATPQPAAETAAPAAVAQAYDPNSVVHYLEAWMPEKIAAYKLRGFVQDVGGEIVESIPGRIRVRVGGKGTPYASKRGSSWFSLGRRNTLIDTELQLQRPDPNRENYLRITVVMKPASGAADGDWRARCTQVFCDLRGYLMGSNG
jgi:eukaryotic-like serine/threonine-protein kinase